MDFSTKTENPNLRRTKDLYLPGHVTFQNYLKQSQRDLLQFINKKRQVGEGGFEKLSVLSVCNFPLLHFCSKVEIKIRDPQAWCINLQKIQL